MHWSGRFRAPISGETLQPPPVQEAKNAMWIGGGSSPESVDLAARLGWKLMLPSAFGRPAFFEPIVHRYLEQWEAHGHLHAPEVGAAWHMFVAPDSQVARKQWEPRYRAYHEWMQQLLSQVNPAIPTHNARAFDFEWLTTEGPAIVGSPAEVTERIAALSSSAAPHHPPALHGHGRDAGRGAGPGDRPGRRAGHSRPGGAAV